MIKALKCLETLLSFTPGHTCDIHRKTLHVVLTTKKLRDQLKKILLEKSHKETATKT